MIRPNSLEAQAHEHTHACVHTKSSNVLPMGSIWYPTSLNFLLLKANKDRQGAYFPCLVNMYNCPISNVDTPRHPGKSTLLPPSLAELALMLLSGVLYLPPQQSVRYRETVCESLLSPSPAQFNSSVGFLLLRWLYQTHSSYRHVIGKKELGTKWEDTRARRFVWNISSQHMKGFYEDLAVKVS